MPNLELNLEERYTLFGVRSKLNDYTFAYSINKKLNINLCRDEEDLLMIDFDQKVFFSLYNFYDDQNDNMWSLIKNKTQRRISEKIGLFKDNQMMSYKYLIKEHKNFDYVIKVTGLIFNKKEIIYLINNINNIEIITEINDIDNLSIKSKENLCF